MQREYEPEEQNGTGSQDTVHLQEPESEPAPSEGYQTFPGITLLEQRDRQRQQLGSRLHQLALEIEASEGYRIHNGVKRLKKSYFVFDGNYLNLKHLLEEFEQPAVFLKLWEDKNHHKLDLYINEVVRYFHNYLAGVVTLLEQMRVFIEDTHQKAGFIGEYEQRIEQQVDRALLPHFMQDLRHYMLYKDLPLALAELNFSSEGGDMELNSAIKLDVATLRDWQGWSELGREYLDTLDEKVRLSNIASDYGSVITGLYRWLALRQSELHNDALRHLEELEGEREHLQQEMKRLDDLFEVTERATSSMREEREMLMAELKRERELTEQLKTELEKAQRPWWRR